MKKRKNQKQMMIIGIQYLLITILILTVMFPLFLVFVNSFKTHSDIVRNPVALPTEFYLENFKKAWELGNFGRGFFNSIKLVSSTIVIVLISSSLAGYVLGTKNLKGASIIKSYYLLAMTVPLQLFLFPLYSIFAKLHLIGNIYAVAFILAAINMPLSVMLMRTFFMNVPIEIEEAARIDGASGTQVLTRVMLPMVSPGMITVSVVVGISAWNEFLMSSTFLQGEKNFTVTLGYLSFNGVFSVDQGLMMAGALIIIVPIIIFFLTMQKYVVEGLAGGAVKG